MVLDIAPRHDRRLVAEETQAGLIRLSNRSTRNEPVNRFQLGLQSRGDVEIGVALSLGGLTSKITAIIGRPSGLRHVTVIPAGATRHIA